jgi:hypothetical protein
MLLAFPYGDGDVTGGSIALVTYNSSSRHSYLPSASSSTISTAKLVIYTKVVTQLIPSLFAVQRSTTLLGVSIVSGLNPSKSLPVPNNTKLLNDTLYVVCIHRTSSVLSSV